MAMLGVAALAAIGAIRLSDVCVAGQGLPMWDAADHGLAGVRLARALSHGDLLGFLLGVNRQVLWPFMHSLLLAPWLLVCGDDYAAAARLSAALFAGTIVALSIAGMRLHPTRGAWVGCAAGTLALLAPLYRLYGTLTMLEMPGAFLLALTVCLHVWACREPAPRALLIAAGLSTTALVLCKYNYGALWLAPLALFEWLVLPAARRAALLQRARSLRFSARWVRPFPLFMLAYLLAILVLLITGGVVVELWGTRVSVRSAGNPAYGFFLIALVWAVVRLRRAGGLGAVMRALDERHRILIATVVLPLTAWFIVPYPNRIRALVDFSVNRDSGQPLLSPHTVLFYPRAFAHDYSPTPLVGWVVLGLALIPPVRRGSRRNAGLLVYLAMWVGLIATAAHHYLQPRFLFTTSILIWLSAARSVVAVLDGALARIARPAWVREPAWAAGVAALLVWATIRAPASSDTLAAHREFNAPPRFGPVVDRVIEHSARSDRQPFLLGYANGMSPGLVRWQALLTRPAVPERLMPAPPPGVPTVPSEAEIAGRIEAMRRAGRPVIAALPTAGFPEETEEYRRETWGDSVTAVRLAANPRVIRERDDVLPAAGFRVTTFRFVDAASRR